MKVFISTDLEGVCGVFRWEQANDYGSLPNIEARHLLMGEVNAAVAGAFDGGATRVVVRDGHNGSKSFFPDELDERAEAVMGLIGDRDALLAQGFDCAILLGYHSMSNTAAGTLNHTQSHLTWDNFWVEGRLAGEIAQSAIWLGGHDIPVVMVSGDDKTCAEARHWLGDDIVTVQVKQGLATEGALMMSPKRARGLIREGAEQAMRRALSVAPLKPAFPLTLRFQFKDRAVVERYEGTGKKLDDRTVEKVVESPAEVFGP